MIIKTILLIATAAILSPVLHAALIKSPDGHVVAEVWMNADKSLSYQLKYDGKIVLESSKLGLIGENFDFSQGLELRGESPVRPIADDYELQNGKRLKNHYRANQQIFHVFNSQGQRMDTVIQVSNDGVCFRYVFPDASPLVLNVKAEATSFHFPAGSKAWLQPMSVAKTSWARATPAYEENHLQEIPAGAPSPTAAGWVFPALFRTGDIWVLITEAGLTRGYCATRLKSDSSQGEYGIGFPNPLETIGTQSVNPSFQTPYATPWRVITLGSLKTIVESTLGTDIAPPAITSIIPISGLGKSSWSWLKLGDTQTVYEVQKRFIDFAAEMTWDYCLVDALWDTQIGYEKMQALAEYAKSKKIGLLVWYNSNGDWNDAPQTPKNLMVSGETRRKEFARLRDMGISGVKIDFFGGDGRAFVNLYLDILDDAGKYGLLVNFHGTTLPRGLARTYPNFVTAEAIKGYEFMITNQKNADQLPTHMAMLPFTRNTFDPMDFTPLYLDVSSKTQRRTTRAAELASTVLFTSGIQHYAETPEGIAKQPDYVKNLLREIPSVWKDSRFLTGYPGKLVVIARQGKDGRWWIAGLNGENSAKTVEIPLSELGEIKVGDIITDHQDGSFQRKPASWQGNAIKVELLPYGGFLSVTH